MTKKLLCLLLLSMPVFSQNLQNLDEKYGFNKFKLESSILNYSNNLEFKFTAKKTGVKYYKYIKKEFSIFGFTDINQIGLGFYKDRLYTISIELNSIDGEEDAFNSILEKLIELFGFPTFVGTGSDQGEWDARTHMENINQWNSPKTLLGINKIKCSAPVSPCTIQIFLVSKSLEKQINNEGF
jgi:hypothetical protein